jgi:hypothetical protein
MFEFVCLCILNSQVKVITDAKQRPLAIGPFCLSDSMALLSQENLYIPQVCPCIRILRNPLLCLARIGGGRWVTREARLGFFIIPLSQKETLVMVIGGEDNLPLTQSQIRGKSRCYHQDSNLGLKLHTQWSLPF